MPMIIFSKNNEIIDRAMSILPVMGPLIYAVHVKLDRVQSLVFRPRARGLPMIYDAKLRAFPAVFQIISANVRVCPCRVRLCPVDVWQPEH